MKKYFGLLSIIIFARSIYALQVSDPFLIENKIKQDLESGLSKIISPDLFFIQVDTQIATRIEHRVVESETVSNSQSSETKKNKNILFPQKKNIPLQMPGFNPEFDDDENNQTTQIQIEDDPKKHKDESQSRRVVKLVEVPELTRVLVHITLDDHIPQHLINKLEFMVRNYLEIAYPKISIFNITKIPMEIKKEVPLLTLAEPDKNVSLNNPAQGLNQKLIGIIIFAILFLISMYLLLFHKNKRQASSERSQGNRDNFSLNQPSYPNEPYQTPSYNNRPPAQNPFLRNDLFPEKSESLASKHIDELSLDALRSSILENFFKNAEAFKMFYQRLTKEEQALLSFELNGPALSSFFEGLNIPLMASTDRESFDMKDLKETKNFLDSIKKNFQHFIQANHWQEKQFFGFLKSISEEKLLALALHIHPLSTCVMLRFLTPHQSAYILDSLGPQKKNEVLSFISELQTLSLSQLTKIEDDVRTIVRKMPGQFYGSKKEDLDYWGRVLGESQNQDELYSIIQSTQPEIAPMLSRFKFKLEDIAQIPDEIVDQVLNNSDNQEIALALTTMPKNLVDYVLDRIGPRRREWIEAQIMALRNSPKEELEKARVLLTKRFREEILNNAA